MHKDHRSLTLNHGNTVSPVLTEEEIAYVSGLAHEAGLLAISMREGVGIQEKSGPSDKVTEADFAISRFLVAKLAERFATDAIVSEEDEKHPDTNESSRLWLIDPIDGTDNYIQNDGQYSVMIGLLIDSKPVFGWVFAPAIMTNYFGGPNYGAWRQRVGEERQRFGPLPHLDKEDTARIIMGFRDRKSHPWVKEHPKVQLVKAGSIGLKVAKVLEDQADIFVHLSAKLKTWDTAGPSAIGLGAGLDVGGLDSDVLSFPCPEVKHETTVIIGRPGALTWSREYLKHPVQGTP